MHFENTVLSKTKPVTKGHTLSNSIYKKCSEEANLERQKGEQRLPRTERELEFGEK